MNILIFNQQHWHTESIIERAGCAMFSVRCQVMDFDTETFLNINLQTQNSSICRFFNHGAVIYATGYYDVAHLDRRDPLPAITST